MWGAAFGVCLAAWGAARRFAGVGQVGGALNGWLRFAGWAWFFFAWIGRVRRILANISGVGAFVAWDQGWLRWRAWVSD